MKTTQINSALNRLKTLDRLDTLYTLLFYLSILFFIIGFNFSDNRAGGWTQQFMPDLGGKPISDITFLDSLSGFAVTYTGIANDSAYIVRTTNRGDNWNIIYFNQNNFTRIKFINQNTGYTCGVTPFVGASSLNKTTNGGLNWFGINPPNPFFTVDDMSILNEDTIWLAVSSSTSGGVFRTTNGGTIWQQQGFFSSQNPDKIYMYNSRLGFIARNNNVRRTTDGGANWTLLTGVDGFTDMYFADSLTGWKANGFMKKTINGGMNWVTQTLPTGGIIQTSGMLNFSNVNKDTMWGDGGYVLFPNNQVRDYLIRTTNGGTNWLFQIPDTSIFMAYYYVNFVNSLNGWATSNSPTEIHTTTGGDTTFFTSVNQIGLIIPDNFYLGQNYPNPFNPSTIIRFRIQRLADLKLIVYDVTGKEITRLADKEYRAGSYELSFDGSNYSSGIYFYSLIVDGKLVDTKKMIFIK